MTKATAVYLRVSTDEQDEENQLPSLLDFTKARGWEVPPEHVYRDHGVSGAKVSRPAFDKMMAAARKNQIGRVVCWSVSRFGRGLVANVGAMDELTGRGIALVFMTEGVDTGSPLQQGVVALLSGLAEQQLVEIRARTRAGLVRARAAGKLCHRPRERTQEQAASVRHSRAAGLSWAESARVAGVPVGTARRLAQRGAENEATASVGGGV